MTDCGDDDSTYRTLLESTRAIPWRIDWKTLRFTYIGPQIERVLGWPRGSWKSVDDWAQRIHADDRDRVVDYCVSQSQCGLDHEADYRALRQDGTLVWIRDVVHVVRRDGEVESLVGFMFDIDERKRTEERLLQLQRELEELSFTDGLTSIPNRRMFDNTLHIEWADALRTGRPLSLILIDIDFFKEYNDLYGHLAGDDCLRRVAKALRGAALRPRDLIARFGGEEFALILPETDADAANRVAERIRELVGALAIEHRESSVGEHLSVSLGVGTIRPGPAVTMTDFVDQVDRSLYAAKHAGRDCVRCAPMS